METRNTAAAVCNPGEPVTHGQEASVPSQAGRKNESTSPHLFVPLGPSASWTLPPHWGGQSAFLSLPIQMPGAPSQTHPGILSARASSGPVKVKGKTAHLRATLSGQETGLVGDTWEPLPHKGEHIARGTQRGQCELISGVHLDDIKYMGAQNSLLWARIICLLMSFLFPFR